MNKPTDVVIVGAGPAGLSAAVVLGRNGIRVTVLDRHRFPIDKVCGEGVMPPGVAILKQLGAAPFLNPEEVREFAGVRYLTPGGRVAEAEFAEGPGWGIRRTNLSAALRTTAEGTPGVTIREGVAVQGVSVTGAGVEVLTAEGSFPCRLVIGADGLHSSIRRWCGLAGKPAPRKRLGIRQHFQVRPWSRFVEVHAGDGFEAYVTPCGPGLTGVAVLWERDLIAPTDPGKQLFASLLAGVPELRDRLAGADTPAAPLSTGPLEQRTRRAIADGVLLIGDAAGYLDACTGEGITLALKQAMALEPCVLPALCGSTPVVPIGSLTGFEQACQAITRSYYLGARLFLFLNHRPAFREHLVNLLGDRPGLVRHFLSFNMGSVNLWPGWSGLPGLFNHA